jgi:ABC-type oligopeptide transport system ATPase subunit
VHAVDGVSFSIAPGELLGLVGESGSGKSTVANCAVRLLEPTGGAIKLKGRDITHLSRREIRPLRRDMHMVFQDPYSSLNPRMTCGQIVATAPDQKLGLGKALDAGAKLFDQVGLRTELRFRYPTSLRRPAPAFGPAGAVGLVALLIADERCRHSTSPSGSDPHLLRDLQQELQFSCLLSSRTPPTVEVCDRVAVILGKIVESATTPRKAVRFASASVHAGVALGRRRARPGDQRNRSRVARR